jgi:CxxC-x17-CxxC domain-containing protein
MSYDNNSQGFAPRKSFDVSALGLKCAGCGVDITELPFEPKADRPVYCRDCNRNRRAEDRPARAQGGFAERKLVDVSALGLKCAECGVAITELPFEPKADRPVYCRDCNRNRRRDFGPSRY